MERLDANGMSEREFLAAYVEKSYPKPSLTADILIFRQGDGGYSLLLIRRGAHPYLGCWALPGGFVKKGETADDAARRELEEECGVSDIPIEQLGLYSTPDRDPRGWVVSEAYIAVTGTYPATRAGDDAADTAWFSLETSDPDEGGEATLELRNGSTRIPILYSIEHGAFPETVRSRDARSEAIAFDHARIIADGFLRLKHRPRR